MNKHSALNRFEASDREVLDILDRVERLGLSYGLAGAPHRKSRSSVAGLVKRVRDAEAVYDRVCLTAKPENQNGALGPRWWEAGLRRQEMVR